MQQSRTKEEKQELVELYKQSGMSVRAFAEEFNLNLATFRNWLYKKQPETKPADDKSNSGNKIQRTSGNPNPEKRD